MSTCLVYVLCLLDTDSAVQAAVSRLVGAVTGFTTADSRILIGKMIRLTVSPLLDPITPGGLFSGEGYSDNCRKA